MRISDWSSDVCSSDLARADLSAEAYHRFVWHVAADLRAAFVTAAGICPAPLDRALTAAAERSLAGHDEGIGLEPSAVRLAAALVSAGRGGGSTAHEALGDRLLALFMPLVADDVGDRKRVVSGKSVSVRFSQGGRRI